MGEETLNNNDSFPPPALHDWHRRWCFCDTQGESQIQTSQDVAAPAGNSEKWNVEAGLFFSLPLLLKLPYRIKFVTTDDHFCAFRLDADLAFSRFAFESLID